MSGYNEEAYKAARDSAIALPCPFERALLSRCAECHLARKLLLAEREAISCTQSTANGNCREVHRALHVNARFALHIGAEQPWPFGKEIRAQCGGMLGLRAALDGEDTRPPDIGQLVERALQAYGSIEAFPYSRIMRDVAHYQPRRRRRDE